ncbi:MAG: hypothetical protein GY711_10640 [bacterium]|nr:hypothetical protein [bacterium]
MMKRLSLAVGFCALTSSSVLAQNLPDVAVSRVNDNAAYYGEVGGIGAFSISTTSCNVGNVVIDWLDPWDMPVIAQNMFMIKDGHIEHLGYSFLKDSFCAVSEPTCGTCQPTNCNTLGIGCADTYGAGLNDGRNGWAKWGIEATRGEWFVIPPGPTNENNTIRGRLQVEMAKLNDANAVYLVEGQYVSGHDQQAGLGHNNQSWRYVQGNTNMNNIGGMHMFEPGIFAWQNTHDDVMLSEINNDNEGGTNIHGFMWLGSKATQISPTEWRYDYAVQNLNSDGGVGSIEVNLLCAGASLSGLEHRGVRHHSGSPYSNAGWNGSTTALSARWETETFGANQNASAIRWGELHSFSFVADTPPTSQGTVTIGVFDPSAGTTISGSAIVPSSPGFEYPAFCTVNNNSSGQPASLTATGSSVVADNNISMTVTDLPTFNFGVFLMSETQQFTPTPPGSAGNLCLGGNIVRFTDDIQNSDLIGFVFFQPDANNLPNGTVWQAGQTWAFQYWTRDGQGPSNFSNMAAITFCD